MKFSLADLTQCAFPPAERRNQGTEPLTSQADLTQCDFPPVEWHDQGIEPLKSWECSLAIRSNIKMIMSLIPGEPLGLIVNGRKSRV